jgi:pyruvate ferredoxin oxidoreductase delta subunit
VLLVRLNIGGITEAGQSKKNKTGSWRVFGPVVDKEVCNGCGICELFCPDSCIEIDGKLCAVNKLYCKGCGICAKECPRSAITMQAEGGEPVG